MQLTAVSLLAYIYTKELFLNNAKNQELGGDKIFKKVIKYNTIKELVSVDFI